MRQPSRAGQPREAGTAVLVGVAVGTILVLILAVTFPGPFRLSVSPARSGSLSELGCTPDHCVNVTIRFAGAASLDPSVLQLTVVPLNGTEIVNQTAGAPLHMIYFSTTEPRWVGNLGGGTYSEEFGGDIVNPDGNLVGQGGDSSISTGAVLCVRGSASGTVLEYYLMVAYLGASVTVPFAVA